MRTPSSDHSLQFQTTEKRQRRAKLDKVVWTLFYEELEKGTKNWSSDHRLCPDEPKTLWQAVVDMMNSATYRVIPLKKNISIHSRLTLQNN